MLQSLGKAGNAKKNNQKSNQSSLVSLGKAGLSSEKLKTVDDAFNYAISSNMTSTNDVNGDNEVNLLDLVRAKKTDTATSEKVKQYTDAIDKAIQVYGTNSDDKVSQSLKALRQAVEEKKQISEQNTASIEDFLVSPDYSNYQAIARIINEGITDKLKRGENLSESECTKLRIYGIDGIAPTAKDAFDIKSPNNPYNQRRIEAAAKAKAKAARGEQLSTDEETAIRTVDALRAAAKRDLILSSNPKENEAKLNTLEAEALYDSVVYDKRLRVGKKLIELNEDSDFGDVLLSDIQQKGRRLDLYMNSGVSSFAQAINTTGRVVSDFFSGNIKNTNQKAGEAASAYTIANTVLKEYYQQHGQQFNSIVQDVVTNFGNNMIPMALSFLGGPVGKAASLSIMGISVFGNAWKEAEDAGVKSNGRILTYALMNTASEVCLSYLLSVAPGAGGVLSGKAIEGLSPKVSSALLKSVIKTTGNGLGEFVEESTQSLINPLLQKHVLGLDVDTVLTDPIGQLSSAAYDGFIGFATSVLSGGVFSAHEAINEAKIQAYGKSYNAILKENNIDVKNIAQFFIEVSPAKSELYDAASRVLNSKTKNQNAINLEIGNMIVAAQKVTKAVSEKIYTKIGQDAKAAEGGVEKVFDSYKTVRENGVIFPDFIENDFNNLQNKIENGEAISDTALGSFIYNAQIYTPRALILSETYNRISQENAKAGGVLLDGEYSDLEDGSGLGVDTTQNAGYNNLNNTFDGGDINELSDQGTAGKNRRGFQNRQQNAGADSQNERAWQESQGDFIRRTESLSVEASGGKRVLLKHGDSVLAYTEKAPDNSQGSAAAEMLKSAGVNAVYCDGVIETNQNGITVRHSEAVTTPDGTVYISSDCTLSAEHIAYHENVHVNDRRNTEEYAEYESVICSNILFDSKQFEDICSQINDNHYGGKYDVADPENARLFIQEIAAYVNEFVMTDPAFAEETFAPMFKDWGAVVQAAKKFNTDTNADFSGSASFSPKFGTKSVFTEYSAKKYKADPIESYMAKEHGREKLSDDQLQIVMVARKLGHSVVFEDTAKTRGFKSDGYIENDGTIHIDYDNTKPVQFIFKHELTHYAEGSELYKNFVETVKTSKTYKKWIAQKVNGKDSVAVKSAKYRQSVIDGYAASGIELTPMQAESELIADFVGDTLFTEDGTGLEGIMSDMNAKQRKSFVQYIKDFFAYIKDKLLRNKTATSDILKLEKMFNETLSAVEQRNTSDEVDVKYSLRVGAETDVERALNDKNYTEDVFLTESSPSIITSQKGARNLPMLMKASHIRENIFTEQEAKQNGLKVNSNINYHGLGKDLFLKVIDGLDDVKLAYRGTKNASNPSRRENYFLLISQYKDANGNTINVPVFIDEKGQYNRVFIDTNKIATVFGRTDINDYINREVANKNLVRIKNKSTQASELTSPINASYSKNASTNSSVPQDDSTVKNNISKNSENDTKYMQVVNSGNDNKKGNLVTPIAEQAAINTPEASSDTVSNNSISKEDTTVNTSISENSENSTEKFSIPFNQAELLDKYDRGEITREEYLSQSNENWKEAVNTYGAIETGENPVNDIPVPKSVDGRQKTQRFARTVIESGKLTDGMVDDMGADILLGKFAYTPVSDESAQAAADKAVKGGFAESSWQEAVNASKLINKDKIAIGEKLLMQAIANKDTKRALELSSELADVLTRNGQNIQAARMFKKMTGAGKLLTVQQYVNTLNKDLGEKYGGKAPTVKIDELIAQQIAESKPGEDIESLYQDALQDVAAQVPATFLDKWNAWRYMSMLVNPTTHIRNVAGNGLFIPSVRMKDFISASLETAFIKDKDKRTKSVVIKKEYKEFAEKDLKSVEVKNALKNGGKFNIETEISEKQRIFKNNVLEFVRVGNGNLLETEDLIFKNIHYKHALAGFLQARKADLKNIDESLLWEGRAYAVQEAMKATFNDANSISTALSAAANKNKALNIAINGVLPFKKTPVNIVRRGVEYSPIGLLRTVVKGSYDLKQGKITASEYIDGLGAGISGTVVFALGALLSSLGYVTGGFGDDDEDKFRKLNGEQEYALQLFGKSYTIDWAAPACIPFFIGVETINALKENNDDFKLSDITEAMWNSLEPVINLSMLSGVQSMIESVKYAAEDKSVISLAGNIAKSYFSQALPTVLGKTARTIDNKRRSNYIDKNSQLSEFSQSAINTAKSKIPGLEATRPEYINAWGQAESNGNVAERIFGNFVSPGYYSKVEYDKMSQELLRLSKEVKSEDVNVFPKTAQKSFEVNGKTKYLTAEEYTKYAKAKGQYSYDYVSEFVNSAEYKKLTDEERAKVINNLYKYANAKAKTEVSDYDITKSFKSVSRWEKQGKSPVIYYLGRVLAEK